MTKFINKKLRPKNDLVISTQIRNKDFSWVQDTVVIAAIYGSIRPDNPKSLVGRGPLIKARWVERGQQHGAS